jgi:hypothetical protein
MMPIRMEINRIRMSSALIRISRPFVQPAVGKFHFKSDLALHAFKPERISEHHKNGIRLMRVYQQLSAYWA